MKFPFVSRALFEEVRRQRDELKRERDRWVDIICQQNWERQVHDSLPVPSASAASPVEVKEEPQATEEELQDQYQREQALIASLARTRKSQLPAAMEKIMQSRIFRRAKAAVTQEPVKRPDVIGRFEKLKAETLKSIH